MSDDDQKGTGMTLGTARGLIGSAVVYRPRPGVVEQGVIMSVNDRYVFVRYGAQMTSQATDPEHLVPLIARTSYA